MHEQEWVERIARAIQGRLRVKHARVETRLRLAYGHEIAKYTDPGADATPVYYQTDMAVVEDIGDGHWLPRLVVEAKIKSINTHDAITYSRKAAAHRAVHPYLRYGVMLGMRGNKPLPGRLYRHGTGFDFLFSFARSKPDESELNEFVKIIRSEFRASETLQKIIYESRRRERDRYTMLHRKLVLR